MYTLEYGLYPIASILLCGCLYAIYRHALQLKCTARMAQMFILASLLATTACTLLSVVKLKEPYAQEEHGSGKLNAPAPTVKKYFTLAAIHNDAPLLVVQPELPNHKLMNPEAKHHIVVNAQYPFLSFILSNMHSLLGSIYWGGMAIALSYFLAQIGYLLLLRRNLRPTRQRNGATIYETSRIRQPFSFGHNIFLPSTLTATVRHHVLTHELAHVRHRHSLWLCLLASLVCLNWFNPFAWLLFFEMQLMQELEVDADVLQTGIDRQQYQQSLVMLGTVAGGWLLTKHAFLGHPLKKRLLFMNSQLTVTHARLHLLTASAAACLVCSVFVIASCNVNKKDKQHPLQGCWKLESSNQSDQHNANIPSAIQYKFFGDYGELNFISESFDGQNCHDFGMYGIGHEMRGDTLFNSREEPIEYELTDSRHLVWHWTVKEPYFPYPEGTQLTERWQRVEPAPGLISLFRAIDQIDNQTATPTRKLIGTWHLDSLKIQGNINTNWENTLPWEDVGLINPAFLFFTDSLYMYLDYIENPGNKLPNFYAVGHCGAYSQPTDTTIQLANGLYKCHPTPDTDHLVLELNPNLNPTDRYCGLIFYYTHTPIPDLLRGLFRPALAEVPN